MDLVQDELNRINAKSVSSDFEMTINDEFMEWSTRQPEIMTYRQALNKFWNERLN